MRPRSENPSGDGFAKCHFTVHRIAETAKEKKPKIKTAVQKTCVGIEFSRSMAICRCGASFKASPTGNVRAKNHVTKPHCICPLAPRHNSILYIVFKHHIYTRKE